MLPTETTKYDILAISSYAQFDYWAVGTLFSTALKKLPKDTNKNTFQYRITARDQLDQITGCPVT